ncbi:dienelactone hydrolase family protein [Paucibacter sp. APW11]|uniref:Dienelactone hydrolase family protein n=1 Tax=Roseateles aquae TaxID=3077235 RepID=A0ABU3P6U1_9BURK|nr:dienelactone hydrolase family protein [Paucibacter sp. APW11]MDT8998304.1 dienelactone hydrolase family protein [Paucibacter sp. APW11]
MKSRIKRHLQWQTWKARLALAALLAVAPLTHAATAAGELALQPASRLDVSFISFPSPNLAAPGTMLTIQGKLSVPRPTERHDSTVRKLPAVLILHGSAGVDARGDFYEAALNAAGIVTLQIDMWQARGVSNLSQRPSAPILTYPDAFSALNFLAQQPGIDGSRVGVLGFSWGGLISLGAAERLYAGQFGGGRKFKAHVAHYPVCYAWNNAAVLSALKTTPAKFGVQWQQLTGAPVLIQIGSEDGYDNGSQPCEAMVSAVNPANGGVVTLNVYGGARHAWDRLQVPIVAPDPYADRGSYFATGVVPSVAISPSVEQAYQARAEVLRFFSRRL